MDGVWPTTSTTSLCSSDSALRKKLLQFTLEITTKPPACLLFTFRFCSRSRGIIFDGRACNPYLVELWQLINTHLHLHTCTVYYSLLQYQLLSSLKADTSTIAACPIRSIREEEATQQNQRHHRASNLASLACKRQCV